MRKTHGMGKSRLYHVWYDMKTRCLKPSSSQFHNYGGRGISICREWLQSFEGFMEWALANGYQEHLKIDRIENDGNYGPSNCRWTTQAEQAINKRKKANTSSRFIGVSWERVNKKWNAHIKRNRKQKNLGNFDTESEAKAAYDCAARNFKLKGSFA